MKNRLLSAIIITVVLIPVLLVGYILIGSPIHSIPVSMKVKDYIAENYSLLDLKVGGTHYNWYDNIYITRVFYNNDSDIYFEVWYSSNSGITDRYFYGNFPASYVELVLIPLIEERFGDELKSFIIGKCRKRVFIVKEPAYFENAEAEFLAAKMIEYRDFIEQNGFSFESYSIRFRRTNNSGSVVVEVRAQYINDELIELIEEMQENVNPSSGTFVDSRAGLRYEDFSIPE
jgi:hypothetical protein